eukprot:gene11897-8181_t
MRKKKKRRRAEKGLGFLAQRILRKENKDKQGLIGRSNDYCPPVREESKTKRNLFLSLASTKTKEKAKHLYFPISRERQPCKTTDGCSQLLVLVQVATGEGRATHMQGGNTYLSRYIHIYIFFFQSYNRAMDKKGGGGWVREDVAVPFIMLLLLLVTCGGPRSTRIVHASFLLGSLSFFIIVIIYLFILGGGGAGGGGSMCVATIRHVVEHILTST